jgi:O-antigen/teichoic acid export membrane protein
VNVKKYFRLNQFRKNILSGSIVHGLNILVVLIGYPLYIHYLGFELFSVWVLLSVVIAFAKMGELGISKAIISFVAKAKAQGDFYEIRKIASNSIYIIIIPSIIIPILLWLLRNEIIHLLNIPIKHQEEAMLVIPYIGIAIISFLIYDIFSGIISGLGRLDISNLFLLILNIIKISFSVLFLYLGYSLFGMIYSILISNILLISIAIILITLKFNIPIIKITTPSRNNIYKLINFGSSILGMQIVNMFSLPLIKVILSKSIGVEAVGIFELASKAGYAIRTLFQKGLFAIMPEISYLFNKNEKRELNRKIVYNKVKRLSKALTYLAIPFFVLLSITAPIWLKLWLGDSYDKNILFGYWLLQPGIIIGLLALPSFYALMATKNERNCFYESVLRMVFVLIFFSIFIILKMGTVYAFLFLSISVVLSNLYILNVFRHKYKVY